MHHNDEITEEPRTDSRTRAAGTKEAIRLAKKGYAFQRVADWLWSWDFQIPTSGPSVKKMIAEGGAPVIHTDGTTPEERAERKRPDKAMVDLSPLGDDAKTVLDLIDRLLSRPRAAQKKVDRKRTTRRKAAKR